MYKWTLYFSFKKIAEKNSRIQNWWEKKHMTRWAPKKEKKKETSETTLKKKQKQKRKERR